MAFQHDSSIIEMDLIIPSGDRVDALAGTLNKLRRATVTSFIRHTIVVFRANDAETRAVIRNHNGDQWPIKTIEVPKYTGNASMARNAGIRAAKSSHVVCLDNDIIVPSDFFHRLQRCANIHPNSVLLPRTDIILRMGKEVIIEDPRKNWLGSASVRRWPWRMLWSACFCCPLKEARKGFDVSFRGWGQEDVDMGYRLHRHGMRFVYFGDLCVLHDVGFNPRNPFTRRRMGIDYSFDEFCDNLCRFVLFHWKDREAVRYVFEAELVWFGFISDGELGLLEEKGDFGHIVIEHMLQRFRKRNCDEVKALGDFERRYQQIMQLSSETENTDQGSLSELIIFRDNKPSEPWQVA